MYLTVYYIRERGHYVWRHESKAFKRETSAQAHIDKLNADCERTVYAGFRPWIIMWVQPEVD